MTESDPASPITPLRARRILAALIGGFSPESIGAEENLPTSAIEQAVSDELSRRWLAPASHFAKIQIARLESFWVQIVDRIEDGELAALDRALRIFDRLDRYHGFDRARPPIERFGEEHRTKLMTKINAAVANLARAGQDNSDA